MFKVSDFLSHFNKHNEFARTSKFEVRIAPPTGVPNLATYDLRFQCEATELPGYNVNTVENRQYGVGLPIASAPVAFADITLTFICAGDMWEKKLFDTWMNAVIPINNYNPRYKDDYISSKIEICQFDGVATSEQATATSAKIYSAILFNAFPISIGALNLNWADDGIHRLPVTFKYDYWESGIKGTDLGLPSTRTNPITGARTSVPGRVEPVPSGSNPPTTGNRGQDTSTGFRTQSGFGGAITTRPIDRPPIGPNGI